MSLLTYSTVMISDYSKYKGSYLHTQQ